MPQRLHFFAGCVPSGKRVRAVCHCGHATTPRASRERAREALDVEHCFTPVECQLCDRDLQEFSGSRGRDLALRAARVVSIPNPMPGESAEFFACRDTNTCYPLARARQHELDKAAYLALGMRPQLRLVRGGAA
jgi:hypothetical protein